MNPTLKDTEAIRMIHAVCIPFTALETIKLGLIKLDLYFPHSQSDKSTAARPYICRLLVAKWTTSRTFYSAIITKPA